MDIFVLSGLLGRRLHFFHVERNFLVVVIVVVLVLKFKQLSDLQLKDWPAP
jgi:hypothetical protein